MIIDLANDPKTKLLKVDMAKKHVEEWPLLDDEVGHTENMTYFNEYDLRKIRLEHKKKVMSEIEERKKTKEA